SGHQHAYYPGRRGEIQLLYSGALGQGPRQLIGSDMAPIQTVTILDFHFSADSVAYTTYGFENGATRIIETNELPPAVRSFVAAPSRIASGETTKLVWSVTGANDVTISPGPGAVATSGSVEVAPAETTIYTLTASGPTASATATATVTVDTAPNVVVLEWPEPLLGSPGEESTSSNLVLANTGGAPALVELSQDETFFTLSPASLSIDPGETATVNLKGEMGESGVFTGEIAASLDGSDSTIRIPVTLFITTESNVPLPEISSHRIDVVRAAESGETFSIELTNPHDSPIDALVTPESPWIIAEESVVSIPSGGSTAVAFTIDPTLRPDATGSLRNDLMIRTASSSARVEITDTPLLATSTKMPAISEEAIVIPLVGSRVDVSVGTAPIVSVIHIDTDGDSQLVEIDGTNGFWLADPARTIFGKEEGILIIEAGDAWVGAEAIGAATRHAVPAFRSRNGAGGGDSWWITGLTADSVRLVIQDVSGAASTVEVEMIDAAGQPTAIVSREISPWQSVSISELGTAASAIVRNGGGSLGRVVAFAELVTSSGDTWIVTDEARASGAARHEDRHLPYVEGIEPEARRRAARRNTSSRAHLAAVSTSRTSLAVFNGNDASTELSLVLQEPAAPPIERALTVGGRQTILIDSLADLFDRSVIRGTVTVHTASDEVATSSRIVRSTESGKRTSAVPFFFRPTLRLGETRMFAGLQQATLDGTRTVDTNLLLVNPTTEDAEVRLVTWDSATPGLQSVHDLTVPGLERISLSGRSAALYSALDDTANNLSLLIAVTGGEGRLSAFTVIQDRMRGDLTIHGE
ncbi:MAG: hypothetical protein KY432_04035, partial [Acidobacteria bacterium]|nr:hypothetical protein [Acidobacteriota bacterium]